MEQKYIDANDFLTHQILRCGNMPIIGTCSGNNIALGHALINFPAADVVEARRGEWECYFTDDEIPQKVHLCSKCGKEFSKQTKYCPNCGAKMSGVKE